MATSAQPVSATVPTTTQNLLASASLYVGDLDANVSDAKLYEVFNNIGQVSSIRILRDVHTKRSLGYAYVNFHRAEDAERAIEILNYTKIGESNCRIMWSNRNPELRRSGKGNVFIKNLDKKIANDYLRDTFSRFGTILSCKVSTDGKGASRGYGFVHFQDESSAAKCIADVNGKQIGSSIVSVATFISRRDRVTQFTNVYVKNLPLSCTEEQMVKLFSQFGQITSRKLNNNPDSSRKTNFGFVNFATMEQASAAISALDGTSQTSLSNGEAIVRPLVVARAQPRETRDKIIREEYESRKAQRQLKNQGVNLFVKNLHDTVDKDKLQQTFSQFGTITSAIVMLDEKTRSSRGFGFVCFSTAEEAMRALNMSGNMLEGKPLYVAVAQRKAERKNQIELRLQRRKTQPIYGAGHPPMPQRLMYPSWPNQVPIGYQPSMPGFRPVNLVPAQQGRGAGGPRSRGGIRPSRGGVSGRGGQQMGGPRNPRPQAAANASDIQQDTPQSLDSMSKEAFTTHVAQLPSQQQRKSAFGERLYPLVNKFVPELAPKITGMLLEMDDSEIMDLLESDVALKKKIDEAQDVLNQPMDTYAN